MDVRDISEPPLVSVVMPVLDPDPNYLRTAVESLRNQQFIDWELIIVEDPSERSARVVLETFSDPRILHIENIQRTSLVSQRNRGCFAARGKYLALMDADDIAHPERLARQVEFLESQPEIGVVGSNVQVIDAGGRVAGRREFPQQHDDIRRAMRRVVPLCQPAVMLRASIVSELGGYVAGEYPVAEDYEFWSRLMRAGVRFANLPEALLYYRIHPHQVKQSRFRQTVLAVRSVRQRYWSANPDWYSRLHARLESLLLVMPERWATWLVLRFLWNYAPQRGGPHVSSRLPMSPGSTEPMASEEVDDEFSLGTGPACGHAVSER